MSLTLKHSVTFFFHCEGLQFLAEAIFVKAQISFYCSWMERLKNGARMEEWNLSFGGEASFFSLAYD